MRTCFAAIALLLLAASCNEPQPRVVVESASEIAEQAQSAWLDAELNFEPRLTVSGAMDIRSAVMLHAGDGEYSYTVQLRDYSDRAEGRPDRQSIVQFEAGSEKPMRVELAESLTPLKLLRSVDAERLYISAIDYAAAQGGNAAISLSSIGAEGKTSPLFEGLSSVPFSFCDAMKVSAIPLSKASVSNGIVRTSITLTGQLQILELVTSELSNATKPTMRTANSHIAGFQSAEGDGNNEVLFYARRLTGSEERTFAFSNPAAAPGWIPPFDIATDGSLAAITSYNAEPEAEKLSFRLLSCRLSDGSIRLIEDHMPADLPVHAVGDVIFYSRQDAQADRLMWQVWASSTDGLKKRLIYEVENAVYVSIEDTTADRLLLHRQYFPSEESAQLEAELLEVSAERLVSGAMSIDGPQAIAAEPEEGEGLNDPGFIPDGDLFTEDKSRSNNRGSGSGPPPISTPD